jgi:uncharacterized protein (DUF2267 family)
MSHPFDHTMDDAWRHERFVVTIQQRTGIGWDKAERAVQATLETLAERVSAGVARDLAGRLPVAARRWLQPQGDAQPLDPVAFIRRVAEREETDPATAEAHVRAVFLALARLLTEHELGELVAELPERRGLRGGESSACNRSRPVPSDGPLRAPRGHALKRGHRTRRPRVRPDQEGALTGRSCRLLGGAPPRLADRGRRPIPECWRHE